MDHPDLWILRQNILRFERLLDAETLESRRRVISQLLADARRTVAEIEARSGTSTNR